MRISLIFMVQFWPIVPPTSHPAGVLRPWAARPHLTRYGGPRRGGQYGGGLPFAFFPICSCACDGSRCGFHVSPQLFPPAPIPRACHGPGWSGRIHPGAAAPAGLGNMAGGYDVCVFPVCGCACDIDWSQMRISCFLPIIFPTGHPAGVPRFWVVRPNVFRCGGPRWAGKYRGGVCCLRFVP